MNIAGIVTSKEEAKEITYIAKLFVVGNRFQKLGKKSRN